MPDQHDGFPAPESNWQTCWRRGAAVFRAVEQTEAVCALCQALVTGDMAALAFVGRVMRAHHYHPRVAAEEFARQRGAKKGRALGRVQPVEHRAREQNESTGRTTS